MNKNIVLLILLNFVNYTLYAQDLNEAIELKIGSAVRIDAVDNQIFIVSSISKFKSKVIFRIYSSKDIADSSIVLKLLLPVVNGYDYNLSDSDLKTKMKQVDGNWRLRFSDIRWSEGTYVFTIPLVQSLSRFTERLKICLTNI
jgi:hypothetical protein